MLFITPAKADVVFQIDLDSATPGIQSVRDVTAGQIFNVDLYMLISGVNTVSGFSLGLAFDNSELSVSSVDTGTRPSGFS